MIAYNYYLLLAYICVPTGFHAMLTAIVR